MANTRALESTLFSANHNGVIFSSHIISMFIVQKNKQRYLCAKNITNLITLAIT